MRCLDSAQFVSENGKAGGKGVTGLETRSANFVRAARLNDVRAARQMHIRVADHSLALFFHDGRVYAVDNRCPHMGFPLHRGTVQNGILTFHWHHARFDLASGGTFDQFADDVRAYPVELRGEDLWIDLAPRHDERAHQLKRLHDGLERDIRLVTAKAAIALLDGGG